MELIDTHCHLDTDAFCNDRPEVIDRCRDKGIHNIVVPAIKRSEWLQLLMLCETQKGLLPALGLHPMFINEHTDLHLKELDEWLAKHHDQLVAVGEIGLDYYDKKLDRKRQQQIFESQLFSAQHALLPVILHVRKAHDRVIKTLKNIPVKGGIVHAFSGSMQQAEQYMTMGFKLGFGGTLTYAHSVKVHALARELPLENIVLETDAPDMVVASHRGERNSPEYLVDVLSSLAKIRGLPVEDIATQTTENARSILGIKD